MLHLEEHENYSVYKSSLHAAAKSHRELMEDGGEIPMNELCELCHDYAWSQGFWRELDQRKPEVINSKLMLIVTEIAEACEAERHQDPENFREEIADSLIRIFDLCGAVGIKDIYGEIAKKMAKNWQREPMHGKVA